MQSNDDKETRSRWLIFIASVFLVKFLIFAIDPLPMFYLGDSHSYLTTSLTGWIPLDRSFLYGFVIRITAVASHSLAMLVILQVVTSGLNAILLAYALQKFFSTAPRLAFSLGFLCAIEPLQLMYERYVMTESLSLFLFVIYIVLSFRYLRKPRLFLIALIQVIGIGIISFRLSFLPIVLLNALLLPLLASPGQSVIETVKWHPFSFLSEKFPSGASWRFIALQLIFSIGLTYGLHFGYRNLNGLLSEKPPAYQYQSGIFLLAYLSPIVKPVDFPRADLIDQVFGDLKYDWRDRHSRDKTHWAPGGLIARINATIPDILEADHEAWQTAINAIKRDPTKLVSLALSTFADYWNLTILRPDMQSDRGDMALPKDMLQALRDHFRLYADRLPFLETFTNRYFLAAWPWYLFLLCTPLFALTSLFLCSRRDCSSHLIVFIASSVIVSLACTLVEGPTVRYLHAMGWLSFLIIGLLSERIRIKWLSLK